MNKTRESIKQFGSKEDYLERYRILRNRRDRAAAESVRLTNVLKHMHQGALDRGWKITSEDLG